MRRSLWVILLGLHVIALGFAIRSRLSDFNVSGTTFRIVSLFLTSVFLALKVVDVRCLRFTPGWRSVAASIALVALLHVMVVERATNGAISAQTSQSVVLALVGSTAGVDLVRTIVRRLAVRVFADSQPEGDREFAILGRQRPRSSVLLWFNWVPAQFAARPPPLCS
ncbi:MAG: hypothetical protein HY287_01335 [Planctomycetes bacterium]|nr:hypothetical protein [Planctomycetota bacterium]